MRAVGEGNGHAAADSFRGVPLVAWPLGLAADPGTIFSREDENPPRTAPARLLRRQLRYAGVSWRHAPCPRTGKGSGDRDLGLMSEKAREAYAHFTAGEVDAAYAYLRAAAEKQIDSKYDGV